MTRARRRRKKGPLVIQYKDADRPDLVVPTEHDEQVMVIRWANLNTGRYPCLEYLYAVPNGARVAPKQANTLSAEGMKPGVTDLVLPYAAGGFFGMYLEMKRLARSKTSDEQKRWLKYLADQNYYAVVAKGHDEAITRLRYYLNLRPTAINRS